MCFKMTAERIKMEDIYIDYPFEEVMFRRKHPNGKIYRKFYVEKEDKDPVFSGNRLYFDAVNFGEEITQEKYNKGKEKNDFRFSNSGH